MMRRVLSILTVVAVVLTVAGAAPAMAQSPFPACGWFYTQGDSGPYRSKGVALYDENWYGWHHWCESPAQGWYVIA